MGNTTVKGDRIAKDIKQYGCHVIHVMAEGDLPPFSYSVGIEQYSGAPEIVVIGLKQPISHFIVNEYNRRIRAGERFEAGDIVDEFIEGFSCQIRRVDTSHYSDYFGICIQFYGHRSFRVLQLIYPTKDRTWPWDEHAEDWFRAWQPVLDKPTSAP